MTRPAPRPIRVEDVLRGIDGIKDVQATTGNAQTGFSALLSSGASNSTFTVVTEEKANQGKLQETVRSELAKLADAGKITVGSQQGGFGTSSTVDITLKAATTADLQTASDAMVKAMDGVPGSSEVATNLAASQPVVQVKVDRAKAVAAGLNEEQRGRRAGRHDQPDPGRDGPHRHQRLPGPDRRGHPLHEHRRRPGHPAADGGRRRCRWAASPPWSRWTSPSPSPPATASAPRGSP